MWAVSLRPKPWLLRWLMRRSGVCLECRQSFTTRYHRGETPRFCGPECYRAYRRANRVPQKQKMATCHPTEPLAALGLCSTCYTKLHRQRNPEAYREASRRHCMKRYGITLEQYDALFQQQKGCCAICHRVAAKRGLFVDHDHATQQVRALLCQTCNSGLGLFHEDTRVLEAALAYLRKHQR